MSPVRSTLVALTLAALGGWANEGEAQKRQRDVITREELAAIDRQGLDAYQAIRQLRPHFLAPPRGNRTIRGEQATATLYLNGLKQGDVESLRMTMVMNVEEVRYLDPNKATEEYGMTHSAGVVLVKLVDRGKPAAKPDSGGKP